MPGSPRVDRPPGPPAYPSPSTTAARPGQYHRPTRHPTENKNKKPVSDETGPDRIVERVPSSSVVWGSLCFRREFWIHCHGRLLGLASAPAGPDSGGMNIPGKMARGIIGGNIREILRGPFLLYRAVLSGTTGRPDPTRPPPNAHRPTRPTSTAGLPVTPLRNPVSPTELAATG